MRVSLSLQVFSLYTPFQLNIIMFRNRTEPAARLLYEIEESHAKQAYQR